MFFASSKGLGFLALIREVNPSCCRVRSISLISLRAIIVFSLPMIFKTEGE